MVIRVCGIKRYRSKGRIYYYHRATGIRLKAPPGTVEFVTELARLSELPQKVARKKLGTSGALITDYKVSPEYVGLGDRTRGDYRKIFDWLAPIDGVPLAQLATPASLEIQDKAYQEHKRRFANYVVEVLRSVFSWVSRAGI